MCGYVGCLYNTAKRYSETEKIQFENMTNLLYHRGPDDQGYFRDEHVQFGFRRLSIIDLDAGHQPLAYDNERYILMFNGEIYNYIELREMLIKQGACFSTQSDTEVIVALYAQVKEECVNYLRGMYTFVIWDRQEKKLFGARDHFGIKPLYIAQQNDITFFASEKKSILHVMQDKGVNPTALQHYFTYQYGPEPETLTNDINKIEPGHYFIKEIGKEIEVYRYWKPYFNALDNKKEEHIRAIRDVLYDSVKVHMRSDVPVGAFLSGGIDSSIIASIAKEINPNLLTFSVGFEHRGFSEIDVAKETAEKLGVKNYSVLVTPQEFMNEFPKIMWHMDDPLADPAAVPLYFVAKEARKHVTVVLSGEGSDELFGGYNIYREPNSLKMFSYIPTSGRTVLKALSGVLKEGFKGKSFLERGCTPIEERYYGNAKIFREEEKFKLIKSYNESVNYKDVTKPLYNEIKDYDDVSKMQYIDMYTWLRGDILLKADKMSTAHSLELRVPFLDKEVFDVASKIPTELKIANRTTKAILREAVRGIVPDHVLDRKKLGFPVPIRHWLKDEMYDWALNIIKESKTEHLIDKKYVLNLLEAHRTDKGDHSRKIWTVLTFMVWHQIYIEHTYDTNLFSEECRVYNLV
ncbi:MULTISPECIES: asparagine synthase (glutamine-hydrolyzing) [Bacillus cereus group]|uniref:asparagine synthase (glutamine-hydrolyzing) n=1 Tax=Bacillus cereus group TaxID=86661 RepID=UPI001298C94A|nr:MULTISPECIES: asparagine synthase (glutamine-hydrolyzing) [Bacillus cereus group]MCR6786939.1 asparagine synthase (glutamine-hydrolyzing) [Bacillus thuringiensis]MCR6823376.1 asparagine synthase (glutamine-hydrolyzing) [Bacillus thuringiensis]MCR6829015.1 asparagine synthase (glutamine-hydrolyzing) [Bacillus thuringiensis]MEB8931766.1 asparagine synthase (glutamine-hydrolyzing) [Bacillus cereus]MEB9326876.1 asparagine synthase (glutamine-hydrolyzing) [Bacillus cereus]